MKEICQLNQFIKNLEQKAKTDNIERMLVGAVVFFDGKILIIERSPKDDFLPGYFEIPGGRLKKNENIIQGVQRELYEETSLEINNIYGYIGHFDAISPDGKKARQFNFLVKSINNKVTLSKEHSRYIWYSMEDVKEIFSMTILESIKKVLQKAIKYIKKGPTHL